MFVTIPVDLIDSMIVANTAPQSGDDEYPGIVHWDAMTGIYAAGQYVIYAPDQNVYRAASETLDTDIPGLSDKWVFIARNNPYRMIDGRVSSKTIADGGYNSTFALNGVAGALAGFGISGVNSIHITVTGSDYDRTIQMQDNSEVTDEWLYFMAPIRYRTSFAIYDLPAEVDPQVNIDFITTTTAYVGEILFGNRRELGVAIDGSGFDNDDLSYVTYDDFGDVDETVLRPNIDILNYDVRVNSNRIGYLRNTLASIGKTKKCIWAGSADPFDDLLGYGFYQNFSTIIYSDTSDVSIKVRTVA